jgi:thiamine pyrophosphokinase
MASSATGGCFVFDGKCFAMACIRDSAPEAASARVQQRLESFPMSVSRVVIFANGVLPDPERLRALLRPEDTLICADGGTQHALRIGLTPAVIIGDLDSLEEADRATLSSANVEVIRHSQDKDETDLELALSYGLGLRPKELLIACALGRRLDQTLGNVALLADQRLKDVDCRIDDGVEEAFFCRRSSRIVGNAGDLVSLLPWGAKASGVSTQGLKWSLDHEVLYAAKTRGISNEMLAESAIITLEKGLLLVVHRRRW